jgi:hypothetical protein
VIAFLKEIFMGRKNMFDITHRWGNRPNVVRGRTYGMMALVDTANEIWRKSPAEEVYSLSSEVRETYTPHILNFLVFNDGTNLFGVRTRVTSIQGRNVYTPSDISSRVFVGEAVKILDWPEVSGSPQLFAPCQNVRTTKINNPDEIEALRKLIGESTNGLTTQMLFASDKVMAQIAYDSRAVSGGFYDPWRSSRGWSVRTRLHYSLE